MHRNTLFIEVVVKTNGKHWEFSFQTIAFTTIDWCLAALNYQSAMVLITMNLGKNYDELQKIPQVQQNLQQAIPYEPPIAQNAGYTQYRRLIDIRKTSQKSLQTSMSRG